MLSKILLKYIDDINPCLLINKKFFIIFYDFMNLRNLQNKQDCFNKGFTHLF